MDKTDTLLNERAGTHGNFDLNSEGTLRAYGVFTQMAQRSGALIPYRHLYAAFQILGKLARIFSHHDGWRVKEHWKDIRGYARLAEHSDDNEMQLQLKWGE